MTEIFDVVVVGAGPGGIAAAVTAAEAGQSVCLIDDNPGAGGQIWRRFEDLDASRYPHGNTYLHWISRLQETKCKIRSGCQAFAWPAKEILRVGNEGVAHDLGFGKLILATGARERFLPFPGWTLPGVFGAGGLQALAKSGLDARGKRVVVSGSGPLLLAIAAGLSHAGANIVAIYEQAPFARLLRLGLSLGRHPGKLMEGVRYRLHTKRAPYRLGAWVTQVEGLGRVERVHATNGGSTWVHDCDWLACGYHLVPNLELPRLFGCRIRDGYVEVDMRQQSSVAGVLCVGELTGVGGIDKAILEGQVAGWAAAGRPGEADQVAKKMRPHRRFAKELDRAFALHENLRRLPRPETLVCRCEDVVYASLKDCSGWREAKLHQRCGMGACQGRVCGPAAEFLFGWQQDGIRPPIFPTPVAAVAPRQDEVRRTQS